MTFGTLLYRYFFFGWLFKDRFQPRQRVRAFGRVAP